MDTLQSLYDSEINFSISAFWDGGFTWKLGDELNGYKVEGQSNSFKEAVEALADAAVKAFPSSKFAAERYGHRN